MSRERRPFFCPSGQNRFHAVRHSARKGDDPMDEKEQEKETLPEQENGPSPEQGAGPTPEMSPEPETGLTPETPPEPEAPPAPKREPRSFPPLWLMCALGVCLILTGIALSARSEGGQSQAAGLRQAPELSRRPDWRSACPGLPRRPSLRRCRPTLRRLPRPNRPLKPRTVFCPRLPRWPSRGVQPMTPAGFPMPSSSGIPG